MNRPYLIIKDDPTWESVLESLSGGGNLSRFYRVPRHELTAIMKLYKENAVRELGRVFVLTATGDIVARQRLLDGATEALRFAMIYLLVRSMKCWVDTDAYYPQGQVHWKVAHS